MRTKSLTTAALAATTALVASLLATVGAGPTSAVTPAPAGLAVQSTAQLGGSRNAPYTRAADGTYWVLSSGTATNYSSAGAVLSSFVPAGVPDPQSIGVYGGRLYVFSNTRLVSVPLGDSGTANRVSSDDATLGRTGTTQAYFRVTSSGTALAQFGQENKIATLDLTNLAPAGPYYPQEFYGYGINESGGTALEFCTAGLSPPSGGTAPPPCGKWSGTGDLSYPTDAYVADGTVYVVERGNDRIHTFNQTVTVSGGTFGTSGSGNGQLSQPNSIIYDPASTHVFVAEPGNNRISEFTAGGIFLAAYGNGVLDGTNVFQMCGPGYGSGTCRKGIGSNSTGYPSYWSRLDMGSDGRLYAWNPITLAVTAFSIGGAAPPVTNPPVPPVGPDTIAFSASAAKVKRGKPVTLTATIGPASQCAARQVQVQTLVKKKRKPATWVPVATLPGAGCVASTQLKVKAKKVYRAVVLAGGAVSAVSGQVSVKPK